MYFKDLVEAELKRLEPLATSPVSSYGIPSLYAKGSRNATLLKGKQPSSWSVFFRAVKLFLL